MTGWGRGLNLIALKAWELEKGKYRVLATCSLEPEDWDQRESEALKEKHGEG